MSPPPMPGTSSVLSFPAKLPRGVHFRLYHERKVFFAVDSHGDELPFIGVPIGLETERDVIGRLWDSLGVADPRPRVEWVAWGDRLSRAGRRAAIAGGRVLPFVAPLLLRPLHR